MVTDALTAQLAEAGYNLASSAEREMVGDIKEKLCYVALDYQSDLEMPPHTLEKSYELPSGEVIRIGKFSSN